MRQERTGTENSLSYWQRRRILWILICTALPLNTDGQSQAPFLRNNVKLNARH